MHILGLLDLAVYFIAGLIIVLYADARRPTEENQGWMSSCRLWLTALVVGLLFAGGRYLVARVGKSQAIKAISKDFVTGADPVKLSS